MSWYFISFCVTQHIIFLIYINYDILFFIWCCWYILSMVSFVSFWSGPLHITCHVNWKRKIKWTNNFLQICPTAQLPCARRLWVPFHTLVTEEKSWRNPRQSNLPLHRLITETPTRWGSRQMMIQRVLEQENSLSPVLRAKTRHLVPTWQDTDVLESVSKTFSPLLEFTDVLPGEQYVSVSYIKPVLHLFNSTVLAAADDDTELTKDMKIIILDITVYPLQ